MRHNVFLAVLSLLMGTVALAGDEFADYGEINYGELSVISDSGERDRSERTVITDRDERDRGELSLVTARGERDRSEPAVIPSYGEFDRNERSFIADYGQADDSELAVVVVSSAGPDTTAQSDDAYCDSCGVYDSCGCYATPWHPCGNLHPHYPYDAWPKTYYYFRPYNYRHVRQQQAQAAEWGAPAGLPYSNEVFQSVYSRFESQ